MFKLLSYKKSSFVLFVLVNYRDFSVKSKHNIHCFSFNKNFGNS